ncbi:MAG: hypothetical protein HY554_11535 [Elusimicrobia bacterium]|nr:hypothetical protein [Elusimicrobiota bacterium]
MKTWAKSKEHAAADAAQLESDVSGLTGEAAYARLAALFEQGAAPSKDDVSGWRVGRMFATIRPGEATPCLLVAIDHEAVRDAGPLFKQVKLFPVLLSDYHRNVDGGLKPEEIAKIMNAIGDAGGRVEPAVFSARGITYKVQTVVAGAWSAVTIRKVGDLLIEESRTPSGNGSEWVNYAYYFKKLRVGR